MPRIETFMLPDAGEGLLEADVVAWLVREGETVEVNQPLVEIETAKSVVELPCPFDGVVTALLVHEGDTVPVGAPIARFDTDPDGDDSAPASETAPASAPRSSAVSEPPPPPTPAWPPSAPTVTVEAIPVVTEPVPRVAPTFETASPSHPAPTPDRVPNPPASTSPPVPATPAAPSEPAAEPSRSVLVGYGVSSSEATRRPRRIEVFTPAGLDHEAGVIHPVLAKPPVRRLARELGIDLSTVTPSGPGGIVTREDVLEHAKVTAAKTLATYAADDQPWLESGVVSADGRMTRVPVKSVRKRTAEAMVRSAFTAPHVTVFHTLDLTDTMDLVERLRHDKEFADVRVTPMLIVAKALLFAVRRHPEINASWDDERQEIVYKHYVNLGIAAATPRGLIVPNIKDAHRFDLHTLAQELQDLTMAARNGTTPPAALQDGTITITNVGVFGIDTGTPILNPGEAAILAFGAVRQQPWVHEGQVVPRWVTQLALSFDHRLVDGELGSRVLADVAAVLGDPSRALVWG